MNYDELIDKLSRQLEQPQGSEDEGFNFIKK